jgi:hypothetical protein
MKTYVKTALAALVLCLGPFIQADGLQAEAFEDLEKLSNSLEKSLDSLQTERSRLLKEGASVAAQLAVLRAKELLSPGEHRQAEKLLQQSQSLGVQMEKLNRTIDGSKSRYESSIEQTVEACRTELSELGVEHCAKIRPVGEDAVPAGQENRLGIEVVLAEFNSRSNPQSRASTLEQPDGNPSEGRHPAGRGQGGEKRNRDAGKTPPIAPGGKRGSKERLGNIERAGPVQRKR